jgi:hypothetical protein
MVFLLLVLRDRGRADRPSRCFRACEWFHERSRSSRDKVRPGEATHPHYATMADTIGYYAGQPLRRAISVPAQRKPGYPFPVGPCEENFPRRPSVSQDLPWITVWPGASPLRLGGPFVAVNGRLPSPGGVIMPFGLRRAVSLARRRVAPPLHRVNARRARNLPQTTTRSTSGTETNSTSVREPRWSPSSCRASGSALRMRTSGTASWRRTLRP